MHGHRPLHHSGRHDLRCVVRSLPAVGIEKQGFAVVYVQVIVLEIKRVEGQQADPARNQGQGNEIVFYLSGDSGIRKVCARNHEQPVLLYIHHLQRISEHIENRD